MTIPTTGIDETSPAGSDNINAGDNAIRTGKVQNREILEVNHVYPSSGQSATSGAHKQIDLIEQADLGTGATGIPIMGAQTVSGAPALVYTTEDDTDIVITNTTGINAPTITGVYAAANVAAVANIMNLVYPVGSIYMNDAVATNPGTLLGVGTWVAMVDEVIVGKNSSGTFGSIGTVSEGAETHTLTTAQMPSHTHGLSAGTGDDGAGTDADLASPSTKTITTDSAGSGNAHNNIQPSYVAYMWRRTA